MGMLTMWSLLGGMIILLRVFALGAFNFIFHATCDILITHNLLEKSRDLYILV